MSDRDPKRIAKLEPREKPDPKRLLDEIRAAVCEAQTHGMQEKLEISHSRPASRPCAAASS